MGTTPTFTPMQLGQMLAAAFQNYWTGANALAVATYNKAVATAKSQGLPTPTPPMLTVVNVNLVVQLEEQSAAAPDSVTPAQWAAVTAQVPYVPVVNPPAPAGPVLYTIGAAEPTLPGFYAVWASNNQPIADGTIINASNMAQPDGHTYIAHTFGFAGSVAAQMVS